MNVDSFPPPASSSKDRHKKHYDYATGYGPNTRYRSPTSDGGLCPSTECVDLCPCCPFLDLLSTRLVISVLRSWKSMPRGHKYMFHAKHLTNGTLKTNVLSASRARYGFDDNSRVPCSPPPEYTNDGEVRGSNELAAVWPNLGATRSVGRLCRDAIDTNSTPRRLPLYVNRATSGRGGLGSQMAQAV